MRSEIAEKLKIEKLKTGKEVTRESYRQTVSEKIETYILRQKETEIYIHRKKERVNLTFDGGGGLCAPPKCFYFFYQKSLPLTKP